MTVFLLIGASWIYHLYTLLDWTPNARPLFKRQDDIPRLSSGVLLWVDHHLMLHELWQTPRGPHCNTFPQATGSFICFFTPTGFPTLHMTLFIENLKSYMELATNFFIFGGWGWGYDDSQSYLCIISLLFWLLVEVEVMTIRKATSVFHFIFSYHTILLHTSQHYLDAMANPS